MANYNSLEYVNHKRREEDIKTNITPYGFEYFFEKYLK